MPKLIVVNRDGEESTIDAETGLTLMEVIRDGGYDDMLALCGGSCACGTCHVIVGGGPIDKLPAMKEDEDDILDSTEFRTETSRLSCQIPLTSDLDGLKVTIAPED